MTKKRDGTIYNLKEIERLMICPFLFDKEWDYRKESKTIEERILAKAFSDILRWRKKRCANIEYSSLIRSLGFYYPHLRAEGLVIDPDWLFGFEQKLRKFLQNSMLTQLSNPLFNQRVDFQLKTESKIRYELPLVCKYRDKGAILFLREKPRTLFTDPEIFLSIVWSFYVLDELPLLVFLTEGKEQIKEERIQTTYKDFLRGKEIFKEIKRHFKINRTVIPNSYLCRNCTKETICPMLRP